MLCTGGDNVWAEDLLLLLGVTQGEKTGNRRAVGPKSREY